MDFAMSFTIAAYNISEAKKKNLIKSVSCLTAENTNSRRNWIGQGAIDQDKVAFRCAEYKNMKKELYR